MVRWHGDPYEAGRLGGGAAEVSLGIREGKNVNKKDGKIVHSEPTVVKDIPKKYTKWCCFLLHTALLTMNLSCLD